MISLGDNATYPVERVVNEFRQRHGSIRWSADLTPAAVRAFRAVVYGYFNRFGRRFPWRNTTDPYHIVVAEVMLQQTQTERVVDKYTEFIRSFPTIRALSRAPLREVLRLWQGLGYNRRCLLLHRLAQRVVEVHGGRIPDKPEQLITLPGIGRATAAAISAFAFNTPVVFVETNIRTVFIHLFFHGRDAITDDLLLPLVERTLDKRHARRWYSALMDYGAMLKRQYPNPGRRSAHYKRQPGFEGSNRQLRGMIVRALLQHSRLTHEEISESIDRPEDEIGAALDSLVAEGLVQKRGNIFSL
jgi:A/G-specific adenine glycosylase